MVLQETQGHEVNVDMAPQEGSTKGAGAWEKFAAQSIGRQREIHSPTLS